MNWLGIVPAGFLIPICAPSLYRAFGRGRRSATGSILLGAGGACLGGSGLTPWQGGLPPDFSIPGNVLHLSLALTGFLLLALAPLFFSSPGSIRKGVIAVVALFLRRVGSDFRSGLRSPWRLSGSTAARRIGCVLCLALRGLGLGLEEPAVPACSHPKIIHVSAAPTASKSAVQQMSAMCDRSAGAKSSSDVDHVGKLLLTGSGSSATTAKTMCTTGQVGCSISKKLG